jgi:hypothetical protein
MTVCVEWQQPFPKKQKMKALTAYEVDQKHHEMGSDVEGVATDTTR